MLQPLVSSSPRSGSGPLEFADYLVTRRFKSLDGLRAIAILLVFTSHPRNEVWGRLHGDSGVTLFFVLSGFLITTLLLREKRDSGSVSFRAFFIRRAWRIYPMFLGIVAFYCVLIIGLGLDGARRGIFLHNLLPTLLLFPEHMEFFPTNGIYSPNAGTWSIGIEEKFYLVWPVVGFILMLHRPRARMTFVATVAAASFASNFVDGLTWLAPYEHLAFGAIVALLLDQERSFAALRFLGRRGVVIGAALTVAVLQVASSALSPGEALYGLDGVAMATLLAGVVISRRSESGWLASRPLTFLAAISYVFYLVHNFALNGTEALVPVDWGVPGSVVSTLTAFAVACLVSWVIHRVYEEPLRRVGVRMAARFAAPREAVRAEATMPAATSGSRPR